MLSPLNYPGSCLFFFLFHAPFCCCCCCSSSNAPSATSFHFACSPYISIAMFALSINKEIIKKKRRRRETYDNRFTLVWYTPNDIYHTRTSTPTTMAVNPWYLQSKIVRAQFVTHILSEFHLNLLQEEKKKLHRFACLKNSPLKTSISPCSCFFFFLSSFSFFLVLFPKKEK